MDEKIRIIRSTFVLRYILELKSFLRFHFFTQVTPIMPLRTRNFVFFYDDVFYYTVFIIILWPIFVAALIRRKQKETRPMWTCKMKSQSGEDQNPTQVNHKTSPKAWALGLNLAVNSCS